MAEAEPREAVAQTFATAIRGHRRRLGLTQEELAEKSGISVRGVRKLEAGRVTLPRPATVRLLADAFGLAGPDRDNFYWAVGGQETRAPAPAQLPADVTWFTGRIAYIDQLDTLLAGSGVATICGAAGVGKTALAVYWAHRVREGFPDGQLYVDLRGYAPVAPMVPVEALAGLLRALGVRGEDVPVSAEEAAALYRSLLCDRRMLIVLDNAATVEQVRPLLPGTGRSVVLATSRGELGGLVARDGATWLRLDVLSATEARLLVARMLGNERAAGEPGAVAELAELCGYLPLALRIAAANLITRPQQRIAEHVAQLRETDRLATLAVAGDPHSTMAVAFGLTYCRLPDSARRMFRLVGLMPGPEVTAQAAAALADTSVVEAAGLLGTLVRSHLLEETRQGRFICHDLLRAYAASCASKEETTADRESACRRLLDWYVHAAQTAAQVLDPAMARLPADNLHPTAIPPVEFDEPAQALGWFQAEQANLSAAINYAAENGPRPAAWQLVHHLRGFWLRDALFVDWTTATAAARAAADAEADPLGQAIALFSLGTAGNLLGGSESLDYLADAARLARQAGWAEGEAAALGNRAVASARLGRLHDAVADLVQAHARNRSLGLPRALISSSNNLGGVYRELGELAMAAQCFTEALAVSRKLRDPSKEQLALVNLGGLACELGRLDEARRYLTEALLLARRHGDRYCEANALETLALVHRESGNYTEALQAAQTAARLVRTPGDARNQAGIHNALGSAHRHLGHTQHALADHQRALELARQSGDPLPEIDAHLGIAGTQLDLCQLDQALAHAHEALELARQRQYRLREGEALTALAQIHLSRGDHYQARQHAQPALNNHQHTGHRLGQARTHLLLGHLHHAANAPTAARNHWQQAYHLFKDIGVPEAGKGTAQQPGSGVPWPHGWPADWRPATARETGRGASELG